MSTKCKLSAALVTALLSIHAAVASDCPRDASSAPAEGTTCTCSAAGIKDGWVYGTGRYTADSSPCTAAVHAGKVTDTGGDITFYTGEGCSAFASTAANGVTSRSWGKYDKTFAFETPLPACELQAAASSPPPAAAPAPSAAPSAPPPAAADEVSPEALQARADAYAAVVPEPIKGWTALDRKGEWSTGGMSGYSVSGGRIYKGPGDGLRDLAIYVYGMPDGSPYPRWETPWNAAATKITFGGRESVHVVEPGEHFLIYRNPAGVYLVISRNTSHGTTDSDIEAYARVIDFAAFDKLPAK